MSPQTASSDEASTPTGAGEGRFRHGLTGAAAPGRAARSRFGGVPGAHRGGGAWVRAGFGGARGRLVVPATRLGLGGLVAGLATFALVGALGAGPPSAEARGSVTVSRQAGSARAVADRPTGVVPRVGAVAFPRSTGSSAAPATATLATTAPVDTAVGTVADTAVGTVADTVADTAAGRRATRGHGTRDGGTRQGATREGATREGATRDRRGFDPLSRSWVSRKKGIGPRVGDTQRRSRTWTLR